jgi:hypothetical protein
VRAEGNTELLSGMLKGKEQYSLKISNRFAGLEILSDDMDINRA